MHSVAELGLGYRSLSVLSSFARYKGGNVTYKIKVHLTMSTLC